MKLFDPSVPIEDPTQQLSHFSRRPIYGPRPLSEHFKFTPLGVNVVTRDGRIKRGLVPKRWREVQPTLHALNKKY